MFIFSFPQRLSKTALFVFAMLMLGTLPVFARNDCNLSLKTAEPGACPYGAIGAATANATWEDAIIEPKTEGRAAIDAFGYCRYISNSGTEPLYVPFGVKEEWESYVSNHPSSAVLADCSRGGLMQVPQNYGTAGESNQCVTLPPVQSVLVPYKPAAMPGTYTAPPVTYECRSADGTAFTETATATFDGHDSGYGPGNDSGWAIAKLLYSYDGQCGSAKGVPTSAPPKDGLCHVGVPTAVIGTGPFTWICAGGNGGGRNVTCSSQATCQTHMVEQKPCKCEGKICYRPIYWSDDCGHSWLDKTQSCDAPEPLYTPQFPNNVDDTVTK